MKFLHAADIHLDSPMTGLSSAGLLPEDVLRDCTRRALGNLIDLAITEDVRFVIIAGDLYDGEWRCYNTGLFFASEMRRLGRPCFLIRGNHDARSHVTKSLQPPPNVREFSARKAETFDLPGINVALHGRSFPDRAVPEDLSALYPDPVRGKLNIGILHTSAEDPGEHETYAPCSVQSLIAKGYDYWALGHIHQRRELHAPGGNPWIIFPGNIQGRHVRETGPKGCTIVEFADHGIIATRHHDLDVVRWARVEVPLDGAETMAEVAARLHVELAAAMDQSGGRPLIARVRLTGATACHGELFADPTAIDAVGRAAAIAISDNLHIERVRLETRPPPRPLLHEDAAAELEQAFLQALEDPELQARLLEDFAQLGLQMPPSQSPDRYRPPSDADVLRAIAPDAWQIVARALTRADDRVVSGAGA